MATTPVILNPVILNVDDNEPSRYARSRILSLAGFQVHNAANGQDTLAALSDVRPDLVLLDVNLPDISGIEVCRRIKQDPESASIIVLQISASAISPPQATQALNSGADSYLIEPVDPDVLIASIRALLRLRYVERELTRSNTALRDANRRLEELNAALRRSNEDLEQFGYVASHDLQEPLRTVTTRLQILRRKASARLDPAEIGFLDTAVLGAQRMAQLIDDLLSYSRLGRSPRKFDTVPLEHAVKWAIENLRESIACNQAVIAVGDMPSVIGDGVQLAQVFQNLLANSLKYRRAEAPPRICVSAERASPDQWVIAVGDNGIGIHPEYHDKIFAAFKRLHGHEIPGSGIGLALCRRIIEAHHGSIWVKSTPGEGSTFLFSLPAGPAAR